MGLPEATEAQAKVIRSILTNPTMGEYTLEAGLIAYGWSPCLNLLVLECKDDRFLVKLANRQAWNDVISHCRIVMVTQDQFNLLWKSHQIAKEKI